MPALKSKTFSAQLSITAHILTVYTAEDLVDILLRLVYQNRVSWNPQGWPDAAGPTALLTVVSAGGVGPS